MHGLNLINHLSPEEYWFSGQLVRSGATSPPTPLVISCSFLNHDGRLLVEGTYRFSQSDTSHRFTLSFERLLAEATPVQLSAGHVGSMSGQFYVLWERFLALVTSSRGDAISCEVQLLDGHALRLTGTARAGSEFSFVATGSPDSDRITLGNVVSILGGKRA